MKANLQTIIIALMALLCSTQSIAANFEEQLRSTIKANTKQDVLILKIEDLASSPQVKLVLVQAGGMKVPLFASKDGKVIMGVTNVFFFSLFSIFPNSFWQVGQFGSETI